MMERLTVDQERRIRASIGDYDKWPWSDFRLLIAELDATRAELAEARKDGARLEWLEQRVADTRCVAVEGSPPQGLRQRTSWWVHLNGIGYQPSAETIRGAIDAAMQKESLRVALNAANQTEAPTP